MFRSLPTTHPLVGLLPSLQVMERLGFTAQQCLAGTSVTVGQLDDPHAQVSLQQETRFYRNCLQLAGDPSIGLQLGAAYGPQRYGIFGYAVLSAQTPRHALTLLQNFGSLTFTWFSFAQKLVGDTVVIGLHDRMELDQEVRALLHDRDISAVIKGFGDVLGKTLPVTRVALPHDGHRRSRHYQAFFGCPVEFGAAGSCIEFSSSILDLPLPHRDATASEYLRQQCQLLVSKLRDQGQLIASVRQLLLVRPGVFPDIEQVAERLSLSVRTLQRKLSDEGTSFQEVLDEVRFQLAKQYLSETRLPLQEISFLLGYNEPSNFTHAFKRWANMAPNFYRRSTLNANIQSGA
jgi:AraC-like DNA-binding protein